MVAESTREDTSGILILAIATVTCACSMPKAARFSKKVHCSGDVYEPLDNAHRSGTGGDGLRSGFMKSFEGQ
jgi:hypothetical protein